MFDLLIIDLASVSTGPESRPVLEENEFPPGELVEGGEDAIEILLVVTEDRVFEVVHDAPSLDSQEIFFELVLGVFLAEFRELLRFKLEVFSGLFPKELLGLIFKNSVVEIEIQAHAYFLAHEELKPVRDISESQVVEVAEVKLAGDLQGTTLLDEFFLSGGGLPLSLVESARDLWVVLLFGFRGRKPWSEFRSGNIEPELTFFYLDNLFILLVNNTDRF